MVSHRVLTAAALAGLCALLAIPAQAQSPLGGQVNGVCMLSQSQIIDQSSVGHAASKRLQQLAQQGDQKFTGLGQRLQQDIQQFQQQASNLQPQQREEQGKKLAARRDAFLREKAEYGQRLRLTRARAMQRILTAANPLVEAAYKSHSCGILLDRDSGVLGGNNANDLTDGIMQQLNKKMPTISFNLAQLPKQTQGK